MVVTNNPDAEAKTEGHTLTWWLVQALLLLAVVALGTFTINQVLEYRYKAEFLQAPCKLCADLNPNVSKCIGQCFVKKFKIYPTASGDWKDEAGICYDTMSNVIPCKDNSSKIIKNNEINISGLEGLLINPS